ncbi:phytoene synthase [Parasphingorhabdus marina DSM 22363]|uniref:Phytoene synthase n=1 Tax=Parasphingorhabdus marina DSM 22363 TaxID=1123272 RepID=A0A1N6EQ33_9SPHN|nr:phytoene/squalene synthase family protein [Parasphingorhabdus marina]SIN85146.1 phytoene synthase [Parasphingorhabdus marina DSM 22363]
MNREELVGLARASIERGSKSFAQASRLFPATVRERVWLLYFWCRACDDMADGQDHGHGMSAVADPEKTVADMRRMTAQAFDGKQTGNPPFDAIGRVAEECQVPKALADDLIDGFALDARDWRPDSEGDLMQYCYHVAGAVGCMMAIVMGIPSSDEDTLDRACDLGLAFQLANIARDIAEDAEAGRCYLPKQWLREQDLNQENMLALGNRAATAALVNQLCTRAEGYAASARVGASRLPFRCRWAVLAAAGIYGEIARKVAKDPEAALRQRVVVGKKAKLAWIARAFGQAVLQPSEVDRAGLWTRPRPQQ